MSNHKALQNTTRPQRVLVTGSFTTDGSGDPGTTKGGGIASVSKEATGHYRVTLDRVYPAIESVVPSLMKDDLTTDATIRLKTYDASAKTIDFTVQDPAGTAADLVSGEIHFMAQCRYTGVV